MRKAGVDSRTQEKRITATTRQLESMIRLSEAHARMRWSEEVGLVDVQEAGRLIKAALRESAVSKLVRAQSVLVRISMLMSRLIRLLDKLIWI